MVWGHLNVTSVHTLYMLLGGFVTLFSLSSLFIKERLYIGEATVATIFGIIVGPSCLDWFNPMLWGNSDYITLELSRIVLIVQVFAVGVELPKKYMLRHWRSVAFLLVPVMSFGWIISGLIIWGLVPTLNFPEALAVGACIVATDPVLASSVVGKGKFSKRVPGHLRNLLSAESGCNDGMAFPFIYLSLGLIATINQPGKLVFDWFVITILYECIFGTILGAIIGFLGHYMIKYSEDHNLIDRESFLAFYLVLALFACGVGVTLGTDDLLVAFSAGAAFSWDGWFVEKTEEAHVSNVIDLLLNLTYFIYFGSIIPWSQYNSPEWGLTPWRLVVIAILIILFRRIPAMLACKPFIPDVRTWREALFCGHFGPIGVGALFIAILARGELEHGEPTPLAVLPPPGSPNYLIIELIWPIVTFLVVCSIIVHGSSIAVFTLGKHINTITFTMSYTREPQDGPTWLSRLPRIEIGQSVSIRKESSIARPPTARKFPRGRASVEDTRSENFPPDVLGSIPPSNLSDIEKPSNQTSESTLKNGEREVQIENGSQVDNQRDVRNGSRRRRGNIYAYQMDDAVVWENEEGEVIRRYNIPKEESHYAPTYERMKVWFRNKATDGGEGLSGEGSDIESQYTQNKSLNMLGPSGDLPILNTDTAGASTARRQPDDDRDEETAAERRRRVAALGITEQVSSPEESPTNEQQSENVSTSNNERTSPAHRSISFADNSLAQIMRDRNRS